MRRVISASRRTDLVAFFPDWLAGAVEAGEVRFVSPAGRRTVADLRPSSVHTFVLWSKNFSPLIQPRSRLRKALSRYDQVYCLFTITGLGGTFMERGVPPWTEALRQMDPLVDIVGDALRVSLRFDPIVFWREKDEVRTNLDLFEKIAVHVADRGIRDVRLSFTQWYGKAVLRSRKYGFPFVDPPLEQKRECLSRLVRVAQKIGLNLYVCSQEELADVPGVLPSACIDGSLLTALHPKGEPASLVKDRSQRLDCRCTESLDIGSYTQSCPHSCLYCYANPKMT